MFRTLLGIDKFLPMKYRLLFLSISFMMLTLIGCSVVENNDPIVSTDPSFPEFYIGGDDLGQGDEDTKVTGALGRDDFFTWTYNDRVAIYPGVDTKLEYVYEGETGATGGVLKAVAGGDYIFGGNSLEYNVAVLPYHKDRVRIENGKLYMDFPKVQTYSSEGLNDGQFYMVDVTEPETRNLYFKSVGSYFIFTLVNTSTVEQPVTKIELIANNSKALSGTFFIDLDDPIDYTAKYSSGGSTYITLDMSGEDGGYVAIPPGESRDFYFFIPSQNYPGELQFNVYHKNYSYTYEDYYYGAFTAERSYLYGHSYGYAPIPAPVEPSSYVEYLLSAFDDDGDGTLSDQEAESVVSIAIDQSVSGFNADEEGFELERFVNLETLSIYSPSNSVTTTLDLTPFRSLTTLDIKYDYGLKSVKLAGGPNAALESVTLWSLQSLEDFDFRDLKGLRHLSVSNCDKLTKPDFSVNEKVTYFSWTDTNISSLDLRAMKSLEELYCCYNYNMTQIRLPKTRTLTYIKLNSNNLTGELDLSYFTSLGGTLSLYSNRNLTKIELPESEDLTYVLAYSTGLTGLDISPVRNIAELSIYDTPITSLVFSNMESLYWISAHSMPNLESIIIEDCPILYYLDVHNNPNLKALDITECRDYGVTLKLYGCPECESLTLIEGQLSLWSVVDDHIKRIYE